MSRTARPSHPPAALPIMPCRGLPHINVSGVDARGPLMAVQGRVAGAGLVSSITGLYQFLADLHRLGRPAVESTLDLIGPSTATGLLQLGSSVIDAAVPAVLDLFEWMGREQLLSALGIRELRLIGCRTAVEPPAHDTLRRLAQLVGVPVSGTTTVIFRDHFRDNGLDHELDGTLVEASCLPPRKVPGLWPETAASAGKLDLDAVAPVRESTLPSVPWPRFVVPRGLDLRGLVGQIRGSEGRCLPGLLTLPRCELLVPAGRQLDENLYRVVEVLYNWEAVRIHGPEIPDGAVYPVISRQRFVRLFIGLPQYRP